MATGATSTSTVDLSCIGFELFLERCDGGTAWASLDFGQLCSEEVQGWIKLGLQVCHDCGLLSLWIKGVMGLELPVDGGCWAVASCRRLEWTLASGLDGASWWAVASCWRLEWTLASGLDGAS